jgi:hypothetical protein
MTDEKTTPTNPDGDHADAKTEFEILHYSVDQNGNWEGKMLANWGAKEIVNAQTWIVVQERINEAKRKVINGETSPIGFFMVKCIMDTKLCAEFTGFSARKVNKHLKPKVFATLKPEVLQRYADTFEITVEELVNLKEKLTNESKNEA